MRSKTVNNVKKVPLDRIINVFDFLELIFGIFQNDLKILKMNGKVEATEMVEQRLSTPKHLKFFKLHICILHSDL